MKITSQIGDVIHTLEISTDELQYLKTIAENKTNDRLSNIVTTFLEDIFKV